MPKPLGEVVDRYLAYKQSKGKRSVGKDKERLEKRIVPFFGREMKTCDLTAEHIARYEQHRATVISERLKRRVSASTVNRDLSVLRTVLRLAKKWGYIREVPAFELANEPRGRLRYLEREEATRLLDACRESGNRFLLAIVTVALHTGMRFGEIMGLTWDRVHFSRGVLVLVETKSGEPRDVPMSEAVYTALSALRAVAGPEPAGLVFCKADGTSWGSVRTAFAVALRKAKITGFRFHDLRHTCASWLVMDGASLMEVKELLGHKTLAMTLRYAHLAPGRLRDAVGRLDRVFATRNGSALSSVSAEIAEPGVASAPNSR